MKSYAPESPPRVTQRDSRVLAEWAGQQLRKIAAVFSSAQDFTPVWERPEHEQEGMLRYYGGDEQGNGPGLYCFTNTPAGSEWVSLGPQVPIAQPPANPQEGRQQYFPAGGYDPGWGPGLYVYGYVSCTGGLAWRPLFPKPPIDYDPEEKCEGQQEYFIAKEFDPGSGPGPYCYTRLPKISEIVGRDVLYWMALFDGPLDLVTDDFPQGSPKIVTTEWKDILTATINMKYGFRIRIDAMLNGSSQGTLNAVEITYRMLVDGVELADIRPGWSIDLARASDTIEAMITSTLAGTTDPMIFNPNDGAIQPHVVVIQAKSIADGLSQVDGAFIQLEEVR